MEKYISQKTGGRQNTKANYKFVINVIKKEAFGQLNTVVVNDSVTRDAITRQQERDFLEFVKNDKHFCKYYDGIFIDFVSLSLSG